MTATALGAAALGVVLPLLPTTPFLLVAAWSASRHSPELERRLLSHPRFGPHLLAWRRERALSRHARLAALAALTVSLVVTLTMTIPLLVKVPVVLLLVVVGGYLAARPEPASPHPPGSSRPCG